RWLYLTFVIDEGPRFKVRSVTFSGNRWIDNEQLQRNVEFKPGDDFDRAKMNKATAALVEAYGGVGFAKADIKASVRELENEPQLDLIYEIKEGPLVRVAAVNVHVSGDSPHTRNKVALNRVSVMPGSIANGREKAASERRLRAAG